jgi:hypothetical protein
LAAPANPLEDLVDVRIGLVYAPQPLELELPDDADIAALRAELEQALTEDRKVVWLTDKKGNQVAVVTDRVTFVALGTGSDKGRIGFG